MFAPNLPGPPRGGASWTTVGYEIEFAQFADPAFAGLTHLQLAHEEIAQCYDGFRLETDADNVLELVTPPFALESSDVGPFPDPALVRQVGHRLKSRLLDAVGTGVDFAELLHRLADTGINLTTKSVIDIDWVNMTPDVHPDYHAGCASIPASRLHRMRMAPSHKGSSTGSPDGVLMQVNVALDGASYLRLHEKSFVGVGRYAEMFRDLETELTRIFEAGFDQLGSDTSRFLRFLIACFAQLLALRSIRQFARYQRSAFRQCYDVVDRPKVKTSEVCFAYASEAWDFHRRISAGVRDLRSVWLRDSPWNVALGILDRHTWAELDAVLGDASVLRLIDELVPTSELPCVEQGEYLANFAYMKRALSASVRRCARLCHQFSQEEDCRNTYLGPNKRVKRGCDALQHLGVRQDTWFAPRLVQNLQIWGERRLHVVEFRYRPLWSLEEAYSDRNSEPFTSQEADRD